MAEKTVLIDGKEVLLRASAGVPRLYRIKFKRDLIADMNELNKEIEKGKGENGESMIPVSALTLFEDIAYIMAKHGNPEGVPASIDEWLDQFETFSIYQIFPAILELWQDNIAQISAPKKK